MKFNFYIPWKIKNIYYSIRDFIFPRQFWVIKKLWGEWQDKQNIFWVVISESIIHYVEKELSKEWLFNPNRWEKDDNVPEHQLKLENEVKDIYLIITKTLPDLEKEIHNLFDSGPNYSMSDPDFQNRDSKKYLEWISKMDKINEKEEELEEIKTEILKWAILNRRGLWT